ncbi:hypothetical protein TNCV_1076931 [Trichonephila clavipes]|uniref:Uncharacterized protein n=1 Tax=Trichonephila clavipes TaxID=2585209 RepID=A0A8X6V726_TRICX|nr:hypothetical protein TNCV_1076931 [Trichonephila clavipes]
MNIILKDDIPVCQRARRLSCSEKLQVTDQIDDWLQQVLVCSVFFICFRFSSGLHEKKGISTAADSVRSGWPVVGSNRQQTTQSSRAGAANPNQN